MATDISINPISNHLRPALVAMPTPFSAFMMNVQEGIISNTAGTLLFVIIGAMRSGWAYIAMTGLYLVLTACASNQEVGEGSADRPPTFLQVKASPDSYKGQTVVFAGEVLGARRLKEGTRIEILQLPVDHSGHPEADRTHSQGRFIATHREFLDPATLPPGTRLIVTGELTGSVTLPLDETEYTFPAIDARRIEVVDPAEMTPHMQPYMGSGPYGGPYGSPYWRPWPYRW
jgi:outer membrane lipoprotein